MILISHNSEKKSLSFKLNFETTNNVSRYEPLILGLEAAKNMGITELTIFGDSKLVVQHIKNVDKTKHPRMRDYRNQM